MPPAHADDPLRTTDHAGNVATPGTEVTTDFTPGEPPVGRDTAAYVPGQNAEIRGAEAERLKASDVFAVGSEAMEAMKG